KTLDFAVPEGYTAPEGAETDTHGRRIVKVPAICWFTNLEISRRYEDIPLYKRYADDPAAYPTYDNFEAIEVSKVQDIPKDYDGLMGAPLTFRGKHNPDQFEIVGLDRYIEREVNNGKRFRLSRNGRDRYARIIIRPARATTEKETP